MRPRFLVRYWILICMYNTMPKYIKRIKSPKYTSQQRKIIDSTLLLDTNWNNAALTFKDPWRNHRLGWIWNHIIWTKIVYRWSLFMMICDGLVRHCQCQCLHINHDRVVNFPMILITLVLCQTNTIFTTFDEMFNRQKS